jgi:hypothetical protein
MTKLQYKSWIMNLTDERIKSEIDIRMESWFRAGSLLKYRIMMIERADACAKELVSRNGF